MMVKSQTLTMLYEEVHVVLLSVFISLEHIEESRKYKFGEWLKYPGVCDLEIVNIRMSSGVD